MFPFLEFKIKIYKMQIGRVKRETKLLWIFIAAADRTCVSVLNTQ